MDETEQGREMITHYVSEGIDVMTDKIQQIEVQHVLYVGGVLLVLDVSRLFQSTGIEESQKGWHDGADAYDVQLNKFWSFACTSNL